VAVDVEALYRSHGPMVLRRCRALLRDEERSVEAMQDTFVQILRRENQLDVSAPSSLLWTTATRVCLNQLRHQRRHPESQDEALVERIATAPEAEEGSVVRQLLERVFAREQPSTRVIAVMHLRDGMTLEEVAEEVGLSVSGVRKRLRTLKAHVQELEVGGDA
jgi:RNA polymerase sigma-70 factor (ECF subfamily)